MARSKQLIGLNLWIGVMVLVYSIFTMEVRYPPRDDLCYMANVLELNSYKTVMTIISISNVSCLLGSDIVNILAFVSLNKALRTVQPSNDPVQREASGETYQVHHAIFRTLIIVLIMYHLSVTTITIGSIFSSLTKKAISNIVARILGLASYLNALTSPVIIMSRNAKIKRSIVDDVQNLKRALCYRADSKIGW
ncbi:hypothetical protein DPMN_118518 [Dreissena polymorpha]|uniref:G-protein coupled receptors family 1 profile domain-containing protein n=1 Tax=Dreissena polymorpha TaxID=45954 RepID=A0A9D4JQB4_DREPO|nr:hypothetical protein DPMN_118518 [Dreissena polymorpha]